MNQPPPISGGTLLITRDDTTAVAADADRDAVWLVDLGLQGLRVRTRVVLPAGSEPGRTIEDEDGQIHVALRRSGEVIKIDPRAGTILSRRAVCPAPRGLAYDLTTDSLHVACAGGELVTIAARSGQTQRTLQLDRDLRDVVMSGNHLLISRFRSAELIELDAAGTQVGRAVPRTLQVMGAVDVTGKPMITSPNTAWRLAALPDGSALMLHQLAVDNHVQTQSRASSHGPCINTGLVSSALTVFHGGGAMSAGDAAVAARISLTVDVAVSPDGQRLSLVGTTWESFSQVVTFSRSQLTATESCQVPTETPDLVFASTMQLIAAA